MSRFLIPCLAGCLFLGCHAAIAFPLIENPSFEADTFPTYPGYEAPRSDAGQNPRISGWTLNVNSGGINPAGGGRPFADNGQIPDGGQSLFYQIGAAETGIVTQVIGGFREGRSYFLEYSACARVGVASAPAASGPPVRVTVRLGDTIIDGPYEQGAVDSGNSHTVPWPRRRALKFTAPTSGSFALTIEVSGIRYVDNTVNFDHFVFLPDPADPNTPPETDPIHPIQALSGREVKAHVVARDEDDPNPQLSFEMISGPVDATIDPVTGEFVWPVPQAEEAGEKPVRIRITDGGTPRLSVTNSFTIVVARAESLILTAERMDEQWKLAWNSTQGAVYQLEFSDSFTPTSWQLLEGPITGSAGRTEFVDPASATLQMRFYRLALVSEPEAP